ncbi:coenzyme F420-0:L-glutamate ligase [Mesorhizobium sp. A556]
MQIIALTGIPPISSKSDLAFEIEAAIARVGQRLEEGDILVVAQKIVSKAEGRLKRLSEFTPSQQALDLSGKVRKDPRYVEAVLSESRAVLRAVPEVLIVEHRLGHIMANAGIDQSNVEGDDESVLLLPVNPDGSAHRLREKLSPGAAPGIAVVISDSFGRPWRIGTTGVAIGISGLPAVVDMRGQPDMFGRILRATEIGLADSVATAAVLAMGEGAEGVPAAILRGLSWQESTQRAADGLRDASGDLFR